MAVILKHIMVHTCLLGLKFKTFFKVFKSKLKSIKSKSYDLYRRIVGYPICSNVTKLNSNGFNKRALILYLSQPFTFAKSDRRFLLHQNYKQTIQLANILTDLGYIVDVADFRDSKFKPQKNYDLLMSHRLNFDSLKKYFIQTKIKIYLATGMSPISQNMHVEDRYALLERRKQCSLKRMRLCDTNMSYLQNADALVTIGNQVIADSWRNVFKKDIYSINNYGFSNITTKLHNVDLTTKHNFLYFASSGNVLKGLDWLLEIFPRHPELRLTLCGDFLKESDFLKCYSKELFFTKNITPIGWVNIFSDRFQELISENTFIILPSCSEGQPGSVLQCMHAGLIPVVTKNCGIDTENFGFTINGDSLEELETTLLKVSQLQILKLQEMQKDVLIATKNLFSESSFISSWTSILSNIITSTSI